MNTPELPQTPTLRLDLTRVPALLTAEDVGKYLGPISRTLLYELTTTGHIQSASLGLGRGKRVWVAASVAAWLEKRAAETKRPNLAPRKGNKGKRDADGSETKPQS